MSFSIDAYSLHGIGSAVPLHTVTNIIFVISLEKGFVSEIDVHHVLTRNSLVNLVLQSNNQLTKLLVYQ